MLIFHESRNNEHEEMKIIFSVFYYFFFSIFNERMKTSYKNKYCLEYIDTVRVIKIDKFVSSFYQIWHIYRTDQALSFAPKRSSIFDQLTELQPFSATISQVVHFHIVSVEDTHLSEHFLFVCESHRLNNSSCTTNLLLLLFVLTSLSQHSLIAAEMYFDNELFFTPRSFAVQTKP